MKNLLPYNDRKWDLEHPVLYRCVGVDPGQPLQVEEEPNPDYLPPCSASFTNIASAVYVRRVEQDRRWGGPVHDDGHGILDWTLFISHQVRQITHHPRKCTDEVFWTFCVDRLLDIAALCVAAIETLQRKHQAAYGERGE